MARMADSELVRINMGEFRRLQQLDRENKKLKKVLDALDRELGDMRSILGRVLTGHREQIKLIDKYMEKYNGQGRSERESKSKTGSGSGGEEAANSDGARSSGKAPSGTKQEPAHREQSGGS